MEQIGFLLGLIISGVVGALIGKNRKIGAGWGFVLSFFLGFIGWIIAVFSKKNDTDFMDVKND